MNCRKQSLKPLRDVGEQASEQVGVKSVANRRAGLHGILKLGIGVQLDRLCVCLALLRTRVCAAMSGTGGKGRTEPEELRRLPIVHAHTLFFTSQVGPH